MEKDSDLPPQTEDLLEETTKETFPRIATPPTPKITKFQVLLALAILVLIIVSSSLYIYYRATKKNTTVGNNLSSIEQSITRENNNSDQATTVQADLFNSVSAKESVFEVGYLNRNYLSQYKKKLSFVKPALAQNDNMGKTVVVFYVGTNFNTIYAYDVLTGEEYEILKEDNPIMDLEYSDKLQALIYYSYIDSPYHTDPSGSPIATGSANPIYGDQHVLKMYSFSDQNTKVIDKNVSVSNMAVSKGGKYLSYVRSGGTTQQEIIVYEVATDAVFTNISAILKSQVQWLGDDFLVFLSGYSEAISKIALSSPQEEILLTENAENIRISSYLMSANEERIYITYSLSTDATHSYFGIYDSMNNSFHTFDNTVGILQFQLDWGESGIYFTKSEKVDPNSNVVQTSLNHLSFASGDYNKLDLPGIANWPEPRLLGWGENNHKLLLGNYVLNGGESFGRYIFDSQVWELDLSEVNLVEKYQVEIGRILGSRL